MVRDDQMFLICRVGAMAAAIAMAMPTLAQVAPTTQVPASSTGQVGQRQTREQAAENIEPLGRIESRINNRVQTRVQNRIDRNYNAQAGTTSSFAAAGDQARIAGRPKRSDRP